MTNANDDERRRAYPLLGSIQNSVGYGFLGNEAVVAIANRLRVRTVSVPTAFSSARGGVDGRMTVAIDEREFRRGVEFLIARDPAVLVIGYIARPDQVDVIAEALNRFAGLVVLDPVLGSYEKGLFVPVETARRIDDVLLPKAHVVTPNRFEAEVLLDLRRGRSERSGPSSTASRRAAPGRRSSRRSCATPSEIVPRRSSRTATPTSGISAPYHPGQPGYGAGDVLAGAVAALIASGASPWAAAVLGTALATLSVERATGYGAATVDPVAALELFTPLPYLADDACARYAERFGVTSTPIPAKDGEGARLKFAPPKNQIVY